ncbi:hypothetical protein TNCV_4031051 [Trichonephila clavipes]|nr:hypothetical protein TNCV_4031051 [Trichonephila clavipes]
MRTLLWYKSILPYSHCAKVWGMFCWNGSSALGFLEGKQTTMRYLDTFSNQMYSEMLHFYPDGDGYFMDDNATKYRAKGVQNWFAEHQYDS